VTNEEFILHTGFLYLDTTARLLNFYRTSIPQPNSMLILLGTCQFLYTDQVNFFHYPPPGHLKNLYTFNLVVSKYQRSYKKNCM